VEAISRGRPPRAIRAEYPTTVQPPITHVIAPSSVPGWVAWVAAALMYGSALAVAVARRGRRALAAAAVLGLGGTVAVVVLTPTVPAPPGYAIMLAQPPARGAVTSPIAVTVCGRMPDGSPAAVPGAGDLLSVSLDGRQVLETQRSAVGVEAPPGPHDLRVEVITADHREFQPPLDARVRVTVEGPAALPAVSGCPH
jgi:hypothetical protein